MYVIQDFKTQDITFSIILNSQVIGIPFSSAPGLSLSVMIVGQHVP